MHTSATRAVPHRRADTTPAAQAPQRRLERQEPQLRVCRAPGANTSSKTLRTSSRRDWQVLKITPTDRLPCFHLCARPLRRELDLAFRIRAAAMTRCGWLLWSWISLRGLDRRAANARSDARSPAGTRRIRRTSAVRQARNAMSCIHCASRASSIASQRVAALVEFAAPTRAALAASGDVEFLEPLEWNQVVVQTLPAACGKARCIRRCEQVAPRGLFATMSSQSKRVCAGVSRRSARACDPIARSSRRCCRSQADHGSTCGDGHTRLPSLLRVLRVTQSHRMREASTRRQRDDALFEKGMELHWRKIAEPDAARRASANRSVPR